MKRYESLKQELYRKELLNIVDRQEDDFEIASKLIKGRFGSMKAFRDFVHLQNRSNSSISEIIQEKFREGNHFAYLNTTNCQRHPILDSIYKNLPDRTTRVSEQLSYLNKFSKDVPTLEKEELEAELNENFLLEEFEDYKYRNCLGISRCVWSPHHFYLIFYSNNDYCLSNLNAK